MRILIMTVIVIIAMALAFIFISEAKGNPQSNVPNAQQPSPQMFARLYQKSLPCSNSDFAHQDLTDRLKLKKVWWGLNTEEELVELYVDQYKGKWVLLVSTPDNKSCGLVGGDMSIPYDTNPYFK
jgi:hypothetical protein